MWSHHLSILLLVLLCSSLIFAKEWEVDNVYDLRAAIQQLQAGDSVFLDDGVYSIHNPLEINKTGVKVFGNSQNAIIITDAQNGWPNSAVIVNAADVLIANLTVVAYQIGIYIAAGADRFKAYQVFVSNSRYGIYPVARDFEIRSSFINNSQVAGVKPTYNTSTGSIVDTNISYCGYAIWAQFGGALNVEGCHLVNNTHPLLVTPPSGGLKVVDTVIVGNRFPGDVCGMMLDQRIPPKVLNNPNGTTFTCKCSSCKFRRHPGDDVEETYNGNGNGDGGDSNDNSHESDQDYSFLDVLLDFLFGRFWMNNLRKFIVTCCPTCRL